MLAVVTRSWFFGLVRRPVTVTTEPRAAGGIHFRFRVGGRVSATIDVAVEPDGDGTRVVTTSRRDWYRPRELANLKLGGLFERRALSHLGYRSVENRVYLGLRGR